MLAKANSKGAVDQGQHGPIERPGRRDCQEDKQNKRDWQAKLDEQAPTACHAVAAGSQSTEDL